jgi:hypothetical protein
MVNTKKVIGICITKQLDSAINKEFNNKSGYIEYLIYQDLSSKLIDDRFKKIIL